MRFPWNTATSFGLGGYLAAGCIAWASIGWHWVYLPSTLAALAAGYGVSAWLGGITAGKTSRFLTCIMAGVAVEIATLMAGVVAFGAVNTFLAWLEDVGVVNADLGPVYSLQGASVDFVVKPAYWVLLVGGWSAVLLGVAYGALMYSSSKAPRSNLSPA